MRVNLLQVRQRLFLTQAEVAERTGIAESTITRIETGLQRPRMSTIRKIAAGLGVLPEDLIDWNGEAGNAVFLSSQRRAEARKWNQEGKAAA